MKGIQTLVAFQLNYSSLLANTPQTAGVQDTISAHINLKMAHSLLQTVACRKSHFSIRTIANCYGCIPCQLILHSTVFSFKIQFTQNGCLHMHMTPSTQHRLQCPNMYNISHSSRCTHTHYQHTCTYVHNIHMDTL